MGIEKSIIIVLLFKFARPLTGKCMLKSVRIGTKTKYGTCSKFINSLTFGLVFYRINSV